MFEKRINIFTGHFGSGKTEVAVNFALKLTETCPQTAIADLDIVNPFFRTADVKNELEKRNIWVMLPVYANTNVDVPALPPEINAMFEKKEYKVVFDVGGDDLGARALSRYKDDIEQEDYAMFFVVNTKRIMTDTPEKIIAMLESIEESSRLKVTGLVNNTNLLGETTADDIISGQKIIEDVSKILNIPVAFISGFAAVSAEAAAKLALPVLNMNKLIRLPWD